MNTKLIFGHTVDFQSEHWRGVEAWAKAEIELLRDHLENRMTDEVDTAFLRGQIAALRDLRDLPEAVYMPDGTPTAASPISYNN